jgi:hypothetical protein
MEKLKELSAQLGFMYMICDDVLTITSSARPLWEEDEEDGLPNLTALGRRVEKEICEIEEGKGALLGTPNDWADRFSFHFSV